MPEDTQTEHLGWVWWGGGAQFSVPVTMHVSPRVAASTGQATLL